MASSLRVIKHIPNLGQVAQNETSINTLAFICVLEVVRTQIPVGGFSGSLWGFGPFSTAGCYFSRGSTGNTHRKYGRAHRKFGKKFTRKRQILDKGQIDKRIARIETIARRKVKILQETIPWAKKKSWSREILLHEKREGKIIPLT